MSPSTCGETDKVTACLLRSRVFAGKGASSIRRYNASSKRIYPPHSVRFELMSIAQTDCGKRLINVYRLICEASACYMKIQKTLQQVLASSNLQVLEITMDGRRVGGWRGMVKRPEWKALSV